MEDDVSRRSDMYRRLQRSSRPHDEDAQLPQRNPRQGNQPGNTDESGWFAANTENSRLGDPPPADPDPAKTDEDPKRVAQQRYARAVAALNQIVSTGDFSPLPRVIQVLRVTASAMHDSDPARAGVLNNLGSAAQLTYVHQGEVDDLRDAVWYYRTATSVAVPSDEDILLYKCNLTLSLTELAQRRDSIEDAAEAAWTGRSAADQVTQDDPRRATVLMRLGNALKIHAQLSGESSSEDESIDAFRAAARAHDQAPIPDLLINLGTALLGRYERTIDIDDLDEGISHLRSGIEALDDGEQRRDATCHYADALRLRFRSSGELGDLHTAIDELLNLVNAIGSGNHLLGRALWLLSCTAVDHIDSTGESSQVRRILLATMPVARSMTGTDQYRASSLAALGALLRRHFLHGGEPAALDSAVAAGEAAVDTVNVAGDRWNILCSLTATLITRYEHAGGIDDLERAAAIADEVAANAPQSSATLRAAWTQQAIVSVYYYQHSHKNADIETGLELFEQVLATMPEDAPERASVCVHLGRTLQTMIQRTGKRRLYRWARRVLAEAAASAIAPADQRLRAASLNGQIAAQAQRWGEALESFTTAVELLPLVTRGKRAVASPATHDWWASVGADAAACAVESGQPVRAVELLEQARTALLADYLPAAGELGQLHQDHPDLARDEVRLRRLLDRPAPEQLLAGLDVISETERRTLLAAAWENLVRDVRSRGGHDTHLALPRFDDIGGVAEEGSVVLVNISGYRSDALIIFGGRVLVASLPSANVESTVAHVEYMLIGAKEHNVQAIVDGLDWSWRNIVRPVLDRMGYVGTPASGKRWPRLWWSVMGAVAYLPLHAATAKSGECALDRIVSSYTPTVQTLLNAKNRQPLPEDRRHAVVAAGSEEDAARSGNLPVQNQILARFWPTAAIVSQEDTSPSDFLQLLPKYPWLHVCETSTQFPGQPAASLVLDRGPADSFGLVELGQIALDDAEFAYLGRCETDPATPSPAAQNLAGALAFTGFAHVVGTVWDVAEGSAVVVQQGVYAALSESGAFAASNASHALHASVRRIREDYPDNPALWAGYIHVGL